ncbi:MAG TPA: conjugal transfer protein [Solirubrobacterales bacterium]|nr:conjugal transfer protein [Solirubrobacterales bacterium]
MFGLLLIRGVAAEPSGAPPAAAKSSVAVDPATSAFAVRFARIYLADPSGAALEPFLAEGARVGTGTPSKEETGDVAQAEVSGVEDLGGGRAVLTVACELRDARTLYLAVPIVRSKAGEVAALGAPSIVAAPGAAGVDSGEQPQAVAGPDAAAIQGLVAKFLPTYLAAGDPGSLSYFLAPGAAVQPLGGAIGFRAITGVTQLGSGEGPIRSVLAAARASDPASGAVYPVAYRLELVKRGGHWYVEAVEGAGA